MGEWRDKWASVLDDVLSAMKDAVDDIRSKLIDEGWFGRRAAPPSQFDVTPGGNGRQPFDMERPSFDEAWAARPAGEDHERDPAPDRDFER